MVAMDPSELAPATTVASNQTLLDATERNRAETQSDAPNFDDLITDKRRRENLEETERQLTQALAKERDGTTALEDPHLGPDFQNIIEKLQRLSSKQQEVEGIKDRQRLLLKNEVQAQKTRYDALAKLYNQLRNEHLQLLSTTRTLKRKIEAANENEKQLINEMASSKLRVMNVTEERDQALKERDQARKAGKELIVARDELVKVTDLVEERWMEAREERDKARAEVQSLRSRLEPETQPSGAESESLRPRQLEGDQQSLYSISETEALPSRDQADHWSLSQPVARQLVAANNLTQRDSVRSMSSNRKVQVEPRSSFENLRR
jgi:chromosome segregation ATPase